MNRRTIFMKASRFRVIPVMIIPVLVGIAGAFAWGYFHLPLSVGSC